MRNVTRHTHSYRSYEIKFMIMSRGSIITRYINLIHITLTREKHHLTLKVEQVLKCMKIDNVKETSFTCSLVIN